MFFWQVIRIFAFLSLSTDSRYLQSEPLNCFPIYERVSSWTVSSPSPSARSRTGALVQLTPLHAPQAAEQSKPFFSRSIFGCYNPSYSCSRLPQAVMNVLGVSWCAPEEALHLSAPIWLTIDAFPLLHLMIHPQTVETGSS